MEEKSNPEPESIGAVIENIEGRLVYVHVCGTDDHLEVDRGLITSTRLRKGEYLCLEGRKRPDGEYSIRRAYRVELDPLDAATLERLRDEARREIGPQLPEAEPLRDLSEEE